MICGLRYRFHESRVWFQMNMLPTFKAARHLAWPATYPTAGPVEFEAHVLEWLWHVLSRCRCESSDRLKQGDWRTQNNATN